MAIIGCLILAAALILCLWVRLEVELEEIIHWMDNSINEVEEGDYRAYFEESEYGWGNNVKNYMEENGHDEE